MLYFMLIVAAFELKKNIIYFPFPVRSLRVDMPIEAVHIVSLVQTPHVNKLLR